MFWLVTESNHWYNCVNFSVAVSARNERAVLYNRNSKTVKSENNLSIYDRQFKIAAVAAVRLPLFMKLLQVSGVYYFLFFFILFFFLFSQIYIVQRCIIQYYYWQIFFRSLICWEETFCNFNQISFIFRHIYPVV